MMHPARLQRIAEHEVKRTLERLPPEIRAVAAACRVECEMIQDSLAADGSLDEDLLGLFEGCSLAEPEPESAVQLPTIRLFLDNLWDHAEGSIRTFREEVRVTLLHELGHYLGLDEAGVEALGLA